MFVKLFLDNLFTPAPFGSDSVALKACAMVTAGAAISFLNHALSLAMAGVRVLDHLPGIANAIRNDFAESFHSIPSSGS